MYLPLPAGAKLQNRPTQPILEFIVSLFPAKQLMQKADDCSTMEPFTTMAGSFRKPYHFTKMTMLLLRADAGE
jgi:hypothetical protein